MTLRRFPLPQSIPGARRTARWLALHDVLVPVVVYQMAKVGSSAIVDALLRSRLAVFHVHRIDPRNIERVRARRRELGWRDYPHVAHHEQLARQIREKVLAVRKPARFITLVKDPIARNLSSYFEHLDAIWHTDDAHEKVPMEELCAGFLQRFPHTEPLTWFDDELRPTLGIDVFAEPFPAQGHVVRRSPAYELLVLKTEMPDAAKQAVLARHLGLSVASVRRVYETSSKSKGEVYREFLRRVPLTPEYVRDLLESRYTRHFYGEAERDEMRRRYLDGRHSPMVH
jgi:hypothetical protein